MADDPGAQLLTPIAPTCLRSELSAADRELIDAAERARTKAYAPYSNFLVGCALRTADGVIISGANMENASYGLSLCAEAAALSGCVATFGNLNVKALAVVAGPRNDDSYDAITTPCGRCRQLILEAAHCSDLDVRVLCSSPRATSVAETSIAKLLPYAFGPKQLGR